MKTETWKNIGRVVGLFAALLVMERYGILNDLNAYIKSLNPARDEIDAFLDAPANDDLDRAIFWPPSTGVSVAKATPAVAQQEYYDPATPLDRILAKEAADANAKLPMMVDKDTRWDATVHDPGDSITYLYTLVDYRSVELKSTTFMTNMTPIVTKETCGSEIIQGYLQRGVSFIGVYLGNDAREIGRVTVAVADCEKTKI